MNRYLTVLTLMGVAVLGLTPDAAQANRILLWNTLDSPEAIADSEIGPGGTLVGSSFAFEAGQFGNGYVRKATGDNYVLFPRSVTDKIRSEGTIEMWVVPKVPKPVPYQYGAFDLLNGPYGPYDRGFMIIWGDGVTGRGLQGGIGGIAGDTRPSEYTPPEPKQFVATPGVPFHVALTWDVQGIDTSTDTMRVYRNGKLVGSTDAVWNPAAVPLVPMQLGWSPDGGGYDKFITDQFIVRDFAKTWYGDRFDPIPSIPEPSTWALWLGGGLLLSTMRRTRRAQSVTRTASPAAAASIRAHSA